jgi:type IV pilus assembly protein PilV
MKHRVTIPRRAGFSLIEVLVALVVISVGLLGIAKMQALALSNTTSARLRSLAAIQAASLASSMHADRAYWVAVAPPMTATATAGVATSSDGTLQGELAAAGAIALPANYCAQGAAGSAAPCQPVQMAAADLQSWAVALNALIPNSQATITCDANPLICKISLAWTESLVAATNSNPLPAGTQAAIQNSNYVLYVQP